tara:strand:- start:73 stop:486 length:414 start_codon:yes stop_codon:yes gene_type:complete
MPLTLVSSFMFDFHQKRKLRSVINSRWTQAFILLLAGMVGWSAFVRYEIAMEMKERRLVEEQQAAVLEERKNALAEEVRYLSSERGIEAEMRRQFDVALPGEQVVVIVEDEDDRPEILPLSGSNNSSSTKKWYQFWR